MLLRRAQDIVESLAAQVGWVGDVELQDLTGADPEVAFRLLQLVRNAHTVLQELLSDAMAKDVFCTSVKKILVRCRQQRIGHADGRGLDVHGERRSELVDGQDRTSNRDLGSAVIASSYRILIVCVLWSAYWDKLRR